MNLSEKVTWIALGGLAVVSSYLLYQKIKGQTNVVEEQKPNKGQTQESQNVAPSPSKSAAAKLTDDQYYVFIVESIGLVSKSVIRSTPVDETLIKRLHASLELLQRFSVFTDHNQKYKDNQIIPLLVSLLKDITTKPSLFGGDADSLADKAAFVLANVCLTEFFDELYLQHHVLETMTAASSKTSSLFFSLLQTILNVSSRTSDVSRQIIKQSNAIKTVVDDLKVQLQPKPQGTMVFQSLQNSSDPKEKHKRILMDSKILVNFSLDEEYTEELLEVDPDIMEPVEKLSKYFVSDIAERGMVVKNNLQSYLGKS